MATIYFGAWVLFIVRRPDKVPSFNTFHGYNIMPFARERPKRVLYENSSRTSAWEVKKPNELRDELWLLPTLGLGSC